MTEIVLTTDVDLSLAGTTEDVTTGDLEVTGHASIAGNGYVVDAHGIDRVFHQLSGDLVLRDLTVQGGVVTGVGRRRRRRPRRGQPRGDQLDRAGQRAHHRRGHGRGHLCGPRAQVVLVESTVEGNIVGRRERASAAASRRRAS